MKSNVKINKWELPSDERSGYDLGRRCHRCGKESVRTWRTIVTSTCCDAAYSRQLCRRCLPGWSLRRLDTPEWTELDGVDLPDVHYVSAGKVRRWLYGADELKTEAARYVKHRIVFGEDGHARIETWCDKTFDRCKGDKS